MKKFIGVLILLPLFSLFSYGAEWQEVKSSGTRVEASFETGIKD